jgi:hypothetical protein
MGRAGRADVNGSAIGRIFLLIFLLCGPGCCLSTTAYYFVFEGTRVI